MKKFIVFGYTNKDSIKKEDEPSKEERQAIYQKWMKWQEEVGDLLVSMGSPLMKGTIINKDGIQSGEVSSLSGYMIIKADNQEHAYEILNSSPLFQKGHGQSYELFECLM